jgi:hypothetical protein
MFFHIPAVVHLLRGLLPGWLFQHPLSRQEEAGYDTFAVANVEVGLAFTFIGLATGMIWARIIWGIWWTWDARLTWAFITCLTYAGYLMMRNADRRTRPREPATPPSSAPSPSRPWSSPSKPSNGGARSTPAPSSASAPAVAKWTRPWKRCCTKTGTRFAHRRRNGRHPHAPGRRAARIESLRRQVHAAA